jgi:hypothetical protein
MPGAVMTSEELLPFATKVATVFPWASVTVTFCPAWMLPPSILRAPPVVRVPLTSSAPVPPPLPELIATVPPLIVADPLESSRR